MTLYVPVPCWPQVRLRWDMIFSPRFAHILDLPQVRFEDAPQFQFLQVCTLVIPAYWTWISQKNVGQIWSLGISWFSAIANVISANSVLWIKISLDIRDGAYERKRSIFCRPRGGLWGLALQQAGLCSPSSPSERRIKLISWIWTESFSSSFRRDVAPSCPRCWSCPKIGVDNGSRAKPLRQLISGPCSKS